MGAMIDEDLDTAPGGFFKFSDDGTILGLNQTFAIMLGYEKEQLLGNNLRALLNIAGRIFLQTHLSPLLLLKGRADEIFLQLITREGSQLPVIINAVRKTKNETVVNHCLVFSATQRSKYEERLLEARRRAEDAASQNAELNASKTELEEQAYLLDQRLSELKKISDDLIQFGKLMSHDVQEPIRKIAVYADRIATKYDKDVDEDVRAQYAIIQQQCTKLRSLTVSLEQYISLNIHTEPTEEVNLNQSVETALNTAAHAENFHDFRFATADLPTIFGYPKEIEMLFYHLLKNSLKYRDPARPLEIRIEQTSYNKNVYQVLKHRHRYSEYVQILLTDNGSGFDPGIAANSFKIEKKDNAKNRLLSFGLAFCKKVVDNHFGTITIDSTPGKGTVATVTFPMKF